MDLLTFNPDPNLLPRALCAAGLARGLALVDAVEMLEENERADVAGALARLILEVHHASLYALLGGAAAVDELSADHAHHLAALVARNADAWEPALHVELEDIVGRWGEPSRLPFTVLRDRLQALLDEINEPANLSSWYDLVYRGESTYNIHGLGTLMRYLDVVSSPWRLVLHPQSVSAFGSFRVCAVLIGHLARMLFERHGIGTETLDERMSSLLAAEAAEG